MSDSGDSTRPNLLFVFPDQHRPDWVADAGDPPEEGGPRDVVFSGYRPWRFALDGRHKLIRGFGPEVDLHGFDPWDEAALGDALRERDPVLLDLDADRHERENVAGERPDAVDRLDGALEDLRSV